MTHQDPSRAGPADPPDPAGPPRDAHHRRPQFDHLRHALGGDDALPIDPDLEPDDTRAPSLAHHPHTAPPPPTSRRRILLAVFVGGALGSAARYSVESALPQRAGHFPTATFVVNTSGAFLLGVVLTVLLERLQSHRRGWRPFLCTGALGGWTTYSSLVVEADSLAKAGHIVIAAGYVAITLVCGILAAALGIGLGRARIPGSPLSPSTGQSGGDGAAAPVRGTRAESRVR